MKSHIGESEMVATTGAHDALQKRVRRVEDQIRGLQKMSHEDEYGVDTLVQGSANESAMNQIGPSPYGIVHAQLYGRSDTGSRMFKIVRYSPLSA